MREQDGEKIKIPAFYDKEDVSGEVLISLTSKSFDHNGVKIELLGIIESTTETTITSQFITLSKELEPAGTLRNQHSKFKFTFNNVEKSYETYHGVEIELKYLLRVIIVSTLRNLTWEREIGVLHPNPRDILNVLNDPINLEVGIDEWLHLTFELDKTKYGTKDLVTGRVNFKIISMRLKSMSLEVVRKESLIGSFVDQALLCKYEIMDGAPVKNECVPIRFFLSPYELTPTYPNVNNKFSVQYFINLVLIDGDDKRYYKQTEIILYRIPRVPIEKKDK